jgi:3'-5' exonuclease
MCLHVVRRAGTNLSRHGKLCILQIGLPPGLPVTDDVYVIDVLALGAAAFDHEEDGLSLRKLLEDASITKWACDIRMDSDALFHQHGIRCENVIDLQLAEVALRRCARRCAIASAIPVVFATGCGAYRRVHKSCSCMHMRSVLGVLVPRLLACGAQHQPCSCMRAGRMATPRRASWACGACWIGTYLWRTCRCCCSLPVNRAECMRRIEQIAQFLTDSNRTELNRVEGTEQNRTEKESSGMLRMHAGAVAVPNKGGRGEADVRFGPSRVGEAAADGGPGMLPRDGSSSLCSQVTRTEIDGCAWHVAVAASVFGERRDVLTLGAVTLIASEHKRRQTYAACGHMRARVRLSHVACNSSALARVQVLYAATDVAHMGRLAELTHGVLPPDVQARVATASEARARWHEEPDEKALFDGAERAIAPLF